MGILVQMVVLKIGGIVQDSTMQIDTTGAGYKVGLYIGSLLPFIGLLIVFLLIIRSRYRFKNKNN